MIRAARAFRQRQSGNIFSMIFAATVMTGVLGVVGMQTVMGPVTTITKVTQSNLTENDLLMNAKVVVMNAATLPLNGDDDEDGYIEPVGFIPTSDPSCSITLPANGGCLPADIGAIQTDPWGTQYAYCVWDHGDPASSANRINGEDSTSGAVVAIISAGADKQFETPCNAYDGDPDTADNVIDPDGLGDDAVQIFTYAGAVAGSGGLWDVKLGEPETAVIDKKLEIGDVAGGTGFAFDTTTGQGEFPYIKTDFLASKSGGTTPVTMDTNLALDGKWISGDGGNEGIYIDGSGNVGIGTSSPISTLHVAGQIASYDGAATAGVGKLALRDNISVPGSVATIQGHPDGEGLIFSGFNDGESQPQMSLLDGNVGIGTTSPYGKFSIHADGSAVVNLGTAGSATNAQAALNFLTNSDGASALNTNGIKGWHIYARGDSFSEAPDQANDLGIAYYDGTDGYTRFYIDSDTGNIGIGTMTPGRALEVVGDIRASGSLRLANLGAFSDVAGLGNARLWAAANLELGAGSSGGHAMSITPSGNVGIGTPNPQTNLDVVGTVNIGDSEQRLHISSSELGAVFNQLDNSGMYFRTTGTTRMSINAVGDVGIGTTSPQTMLDLRGNFRLGLTSGETGALTTTPVIETNGDHLVLSPVKDTTGRVWIRDQNSPARIEFYSTGNSTIQAVNNINAPTTLTINPNGGNFQVGANAYKPGGGNWLASSDARLKDIQAVYESGLAEITQLKPVRFRYKADNPRGEPSSREFIGLIAQEAMHVMPELVSLRESDGFYDLDSSALIYALINAAKELKAENDALRAELQAANDNFRRELDELKSAIRQ